MQTRIGAARGVPAAASIRSRWAGESTITTGRPSSSIRASRASPSRSAVG